MRLTDEEARKLSPPGTYCNRVCDNQQCRRLLNRMLTYKTSDGSKEYCSNVCLEVGEGRRGSIPRKENSMIENNETPKGDETKAAPEETKNKAVVPSNKNKSDKPKKAVKKDAPEGEAPADKPKKAVKKATDKPKKAVKKAAAKKAADKPKKAVKKATDKPKKAVKKAAAKKAADKPKKPKGEKVEGNPYRPGSAFFEVFERLRKSTGKKVAVTDLFKGVDFPDQSRMLAHMRGHGISGERGVKFSLERVEGGFVTYKPSR